MLERLVAVLQQIKQNQQQKGTFQQNRCIESLNKVETPMNRLRIVFLIISLLTLGQLLAQNGIIRGRVSDATTNEGLPVAAVKIEGLNKGTATDFDGNFEISGLEAGLYNVTISLLGYQTYTAYEVQVTNARPAILDIRLEASSTKLQEVVVDAQARFDRNPESPVSLQTIGINEIQRNPGGNQDISRVIQALPGVASTPNFRNDLIIRGGAPNENRFFLDGIEIPTINHFATQGAGGGPVGLINFNFIREVDFYTGAFPVERGNTLSSVMDLKLKDGREDQWAYTAILGASDIGLTVDGPLSEKATMIASVRRSYLQFLFSALELPFLPTYNDFQAKVKYKINDKHQITFLGLGAIDNFELNLDANETEEQRYILNVLPVNEQWNYSVGMKYTYFGQKSFTNVVLSRFMLNNSSFKYANNDPNDVQLQDYQSREIENKLRVENFYRNNGWRLTNGFGFEEVKYQTDELDLRVPEDQPARNYSTSLRQYKYSLFSQATRTFFTRLTLSAGFRMDGLDFNESMANPFNQFSPRVSMSYNLTEQLAFNANWGIYYQQPPYTLLGYQENGKLVNSDATFIRATHYVAGFAYYLPRINAKLSLEGFYKDYGNYPFLLNDSITLANLGSDFGVIGNAPSASVADGRAVGVEFTYQQKLYKGFYGILAYTFVRSEFEDKNGDLIPSSWDNQHILTFTGGKRFGKHWEVGMQYQLLGGAPFTPFDLPRSALISNWNALGRGIPDYNQLNSERFNTFHRVNIRVDYKWFFNSWNLDLYLDLQNVLRQSVEGAPFVDVQRDAMGQPIVDPNDGSRYLITEIPNSTGSLLPTIGAIVEF